MPVLLGECPWCSSLPNTECHKHSPSFTDWPFNRFTKKKKTSVWAWQSTSVIWETENHCLQWLNLYITHIQYFYVFFTYICIQFTNVLHGIPLWLFKICSIHSTLHAILYNAMCSTWTSICSVMNKVHVHIAKKNKNKNKFLKDNNWMSCLKQHNEVMWPQSKQTFKLHFFIHLINEILKHVILRLIL